jgi:hypothetical protein
LAVLGTTGLGGVPAASAATPTAQTATETVIPPMTTSSPRGDSVIGAGPGGFLHHPDGDNWVWSSYSGQDIHLQGGYGEGSIAYGADILIGHTSPQGYLLHDMDTGASTQLTLPSGDSYAGTYGSRIVTIADSNGTPAALHILSSSGGTQTVTTVTGLPSGVTDPRPAVGDPDSMLMSYRDGTGIALALVDLSSGRATPVFSGLVSDQYRAFITDQYVGWYTYSHPTVVHLVPRSDPSAAETTVSIPAPAVAGASSINLVNLAVVGKTFLLQYEIGYSGTPTPPSRSALYQVPLSGGTPTVLLDHLPSSVFSLLQIPGGAVAQGEDSSSAWGVRRYTAASDGTLTSTMVYSDVQAAYAVRGLALANSQLYGTTGVDPQDEQLSSRSVQ